jgi:hypothetical protein
VISMPSPGAGQGALGCQLAHDRLAGRIAQVAPVPSHQPEIGSDLLATVLTMRLRLLC